MNSPSHEESSPPLDVIALILKALFLLPTIFFSLILSFMWFQGTELLWATGAFKGGDLQQHYLAGKMWTNSERQELYEGHHLGDQINQWRDQRNPDAPRSEVHTFNYVFSPFIAQLSSGLRIISYPNWARLWILLSILSFIASFALLMNALKLPLDSPNLWFLWLGFPTFYYTLVPGQNSTLTLLIMSSAIFLANRNLLFQAGLVASCAFYKPQLFPYIGLVLLCAGHFRLFSGMFVGGLAWFLLGIACTSWELHLLWLDTLRGMAQGQQFQLAGVSQSWKDLVLSILPSSNPTLLNALYLLITALLLGALGLWLRKFQQHPDWTPGHSFAIALCAWTLFSPYVAYYDLLLTLPWWLILLHQPLNLPGRALHTGYWFLCLFSIASLSLDFSFVAPLMTFWLAFSLTTFKSHSDAEPV